MNAIPDVTADRRKPIEAKGTVRLCLLLGRILFSFGATTQRIQDSITWVARHFGCKVELLVSYEALLITADDGAKFQTRVDSARGVAGLNLLGLARVSALVRDLPRSQSNCETLERALCDIRDAAPTHGAALQTVAAGCAGAGFCIVNGGDPASWFCSFVAAAFILTIRRLLAAWKFNTHFTIFSITLAGSLLAGLLARLTHTATPAVALLAPVLFLVPGVPLINGGIDIVRNHVTVGIGRVGFTLAVLVALCLGVGLTIPMLSVKTSPSFSLSGAWQVMLVSIAGAVAAGALACLNNGGLPLMALCALGGLTGRLVRALVMLGGLDVIAASLVGVLCSTLVVTLVAERLRWPAVIASVMAALPMVPGLFAIAGFCALLSFAASNTADPAQLSLSLHALARALFISVALVVGVIGPVILLQRERERV